MRITATDAYQDDSDCIFNDCERFYCNRHRLLWKFCETAKSGIEGDRDVVNGTRMIWEPGECPKCEKEADAKRAERMQKEWELKMARTLP